MGRKPIVAIMAIVLIGADYLAGYLPERRQRASAEMESERFLQWISRAPRLRPRTALR